VRNSACIDRADALELAHYVVVDHPQAVVLSGTDV
jgi:hypothetical protein